MTSRMSRVIAVAVSAAVMATSIEIPVVAAASPTKSQGVQAGAAADMDFSAKRKKRRYGNAAAFGAIVGMVGSIAAAQAARRRHRDYYYAQAPGYYYGGPAYGYYGGHYAAPHPRYFTHGRGYRTKDAYHDRGQGTHVYGGGGVWYGTGAPTQPPPTTYTPSSPSN
jgi:hypothetical protein